jgi:pimeloyl-ACP methyl ester carboxylesterase
MGLSEIRRARKSFETGALRERLKAWHADVDTAFRSWSEPWLSPDFETWDIIDALGYIRVPILILQGENDQYGTLKQVETAQQECFCPVEPVVLPGVRHIPYREAPELTVQAVADFLNRLIRDHHEGELGATTGIALS